MNLKYNFLSLIFLIFLSSCNSDSSEVQPPQNVIEDPVSAFLVFPENHTECNEGTVVNETQSKVTFLWNASEHTDSYELVLTNKETVEISNFDLIDNSHEITLERGTSYEWYVISKSQESQETAKSETYQFFNAAPGIVNHVPFSAEAITPENNSIFTAISGNVTLKWEATDIDNDIKDYEVFFGVNKEELENKGVQSVSNLEVDVVSGTTYYWMIKTNDEKNNTSTSELFSFTIN
ncbi:hypothetical protein [Zobellia laminariae]|uniref:hypothetical protein n=1 Tax=Zobellia laminariae TaxID=248906 RepID=UPI00405689E2